MGARLDSKPIYYRFRVQGRGKFPLDMLRHDQCFPDSVADAQMIEDSHNPCTIKTYYVVTLHGYNWVGAPTINRWKSFGFTVKDVQ